MNALSPRIRDQDLAAAVCALLRAGDHATALRFADELNARLVPSTDGRTDGRTEIADVTPPAPAKEESSDLAANDAPPASSVHVRPSSSSSPISITSQEKKTDGRVTVYDDDPIPDWARKIYAGFLEERPALPSLDVVVWPNFVSVVRERGKSWATLDGLKKRFRDFLRWERVDGPKQQQELPLSPPKAKRPELQVFRPIVDGKAVPLAAAGDHIARAIAAIESRATGPPAMAPGGA